MVEKTLFTYPSERYLNIIRRGYKDCNIDNNLLNKSLKT